MDCLHKFLSKNLVLSLLEIFTKREITFSSSPLKQIQLFLVTIFSISLSNSLVEVATTTGILTFFNLFNMISRIDSSL
jgi:hypothetical protein